MLPTFLKLGGPMIWVILFVSAVAITVFIERVLHYHRAQINSMEFLNGVRTVGVTAGASAPELLVQDLIRKLGEHYAVQVEVLAGIEENVHFRLPPELADRGAPAALDSPLMQ